MKLALYLPNFRDKVTVSELVDLTMAIVAINGWNRLVISSRQVPGTYQPAETAKAAAARYPRPHASVSGAEAEERQRH